ncbi:uncharacterized protein STEHIDRAFT_108313 [Stereum hirsutum FP-91666 SS1]|uniref:uncharacterized protein n=1 Tax=Stereum hirsutum (strain FP-91666) TaxID=721885 RepID=UPI000440C7AA|nr:uncharacterized protein STEHIDRAFT_108313 [Stereum hirsutum FP-91666 SS1]EIM89615.1 hypothetical protein STEHIDRAFT_108313 [Stereum hirsutum FP-91666 SS1]
MSPSHFFDDCPAEILIECFLFCVYPDLPAIHPNCAPILVTRVCRRWREVALSTSLLWSRLLMRFSSDEAESLHSSGLQPFENFLDKSLGIPLTCTLLDQTKAGSPHFDQYLGVLLRHARRWETISLASQSTRPTLPRITEFPCLHSLNVDWINDSECALAPIFENAPSLRSLALRSSRTFDCFVIAPQLTSLSVSYFSDTEKYAVLSPLRPSIQRRPAPAHDGRLFTALSTFTSLTSLYIGTFAYFKREFMDNDHPTEKVVLPNIHTFSFPISDAAFPTIWLSAITFPHLLELGISPRDTLDFRSNDHLHNVLDFVGRHADTVRNITLGLPNTSRNDQRLEILSLLPHIETLRLTSPHQSRVNFDQMSNLIGFVEGRARRGEDGQGVTEGLRRLVLPHQTLAYLRRVEKSGSFGRLQHCIQKGLVVEDIGLMGLHVALTSAAMLWSSTKATATHSANRSTLDCLADLQEALECTRGHLQKWSEKGGFRKEIVAKLLPSIALGELQDDQKWLAQRCQDLQLAFSFMLWKKALAMDGQEGTGHDAMGNELPNSQSGSIQAQNQSPSTNNEMSRGKYSDFLPCWYDMMAKVRRGEIYSGAILLWIDDEPHKNQDLVSYAQSANTRVVTLLSTAHAKQWITSNDALLRQTYKCGSLRIISDNARFENPTLNRGEHGNRTKPQKEWVPDAGEQKLRFVRERGLRAPVLIWTRSANITAFVLEYKNAGSTLIKEVVEAFIASLAYGDTIDSWPRNIDAGEQIIRFVRETLRLDTPALICTRVDVQVATSRPGHRSTTDTAVLENFIRGFADGEVPDGQKWCGSQLLSSRLAGAGIRGGTAK